MSSSHPVPAAVILVADAAPLLRCGLRHTLAEAFGAYEVREAATLPELLALAVCQPPTLVVVATGLPEAPADPAELLAALRANQPQAAVVMLADPATCSEPALLRLLRHNISGLLLRTASLAEVCATVEAVLQRGRYCSDYMLSLLHSHLRPRGSVRPGGAAPFSARQLEVLRLVARDFSNEEIADYLCTSVRTVEYHRSQMLQKAGTRTTLGLVLFALRQGLLVADEPPAPATPVPRRALAHS